MARVLISAGERGRIVAILRELDPETHDLTARFQEQLDPEDWAFVCDYTRAEIKGALEIGLMARAVAEAARRRGVSNEEGIGNFLDSIAWMRNFGVSDPHDERFKELCGIDTPLFLAVDALLQMAQDRMFGTLDEEYARLLESSF
jgi:hypothetical protein